MNIIHKNYVLLVSMEKLAISDVTLSFGGLKALSNVIHFNLFKTYDTLESLEKIFQNIENREKEFPDLYISTYAGDFVT